MYKYEEFSSVLDLVDWLNEEIPRRIISIYGDGYNSHIVVYV